jgi:hypothetical protein
MLTTKEWAGIQADLAAEELYRKAYLRGQIRWLAGLIVGRRFLPPRVQGEIAVAHAPEERVQELRAVALEAIKGSAVGTRIFDDHFRPLSPAIERRWRQLASALLRGETLPPVELVQVGAHFYVYDGHLRVSVARASGQAQIDALVVGRADMQLELRVQPITAQPAHCAQA